MARVIRVEARHFELAKKKLTKSKIDAGWGWTISKKQIRFAALEAALIDEFGDNICVYQNSYYAKVLVTRIHRSLEHVFAHGMYMASNHQSPYAVMFHGIPARVRVHA